jgi:hypothetical protein
MMTNSDLIPDRNERISRLEVLAFDLLERGLAAGDTACLRLFYRVKGKLSRAPGKKASRRNRSGAVVANLRNLARRGGLRIVARRCCGGEPRPLRACAAPALRDNPPPGAARPAGAASSGERETMSRFREQCLGFVRDFVRRRCLDASGRRMSAEARKLLRGDSGHMARGISLAAALAVSPEWSDEPMPEAGALAEVAGRLTDAAAGELLRCCVGRAFPPNFQMLTAVPAFELMLPRASARQRRLWLRAAAGCARVSRDFLLRKEAAWGRPGPFTGCGPNHLFIVAAPLYRLGRLLGDEGSCRLARRAMHRLCGLQTEAGYFPENSGPVVSYHRVNLFGLCDYRRTSGDRFVDPFIARGISYLLRAMYPNLAGIETLDQRNRSGLRIGRPGASPGSWDACFGCNPAGRRLAGRVLAELQRALDAHPEQVPFPVSGHVALAALLYVEGPTARILPCERKSFVDRFEGRAGIVRRDGWLLALSGYHESNRPGNPFILDRTQNLSLFHDRFGLILGGGNDKRNLEAATFDVVESGYVRYFPPLAGSARVAGRGGRLELQYGPATARLDAVVRSPRRVELVAGLETTFAEQTNGLNLQIPVGPGATVRIDGRRVRLSPEAAGLRNWPVRRWFEPIAGVRLELPGGGRFRWPVLPFNSYNIPVYTSSIGAATGYLRLDLSGRSLAERTVRISLGPSKR